MSIITECFNDVGNCIAFFCTPQKAFEDDHVTRKLSIGIGTAGVIAAVALRIFGGGPHIASAVLGALSASMIVGGITAIPLFAVLPVIAAVGTCLAHVDFSRVVFVYNINSGYRW